MKVSIDILEEYLHERYGGWAKEEGLFMKLVEEMGEIAEILNMRSRRKSAKFEDLQAQLGTELADLIHYAVAIAAINNLDLNEIILQKDKKASIKYHHDTNLEKFIQSKEQL